MAKWILFWLLFLAGGFLAFSNMAMQALGMLPLFVSAALLATAVASFRLATRKGASGGVFDRWFSWAVAHGAVIGVLVINIFGVG